MLLGSLLANFHQGSIPRTPARGEDAQAEMVRGSSTQCTVIAAVALLFAAFQTCPQSFSLSWTPAILDSILLEGAKLYSQTVSNHFPHDPYHLLTHDELPDTVLLFRSQFTVEPMGTFLYGIVSHQTLAEETQVDAESGAMTL